MNDFYFVKGLCSVAAMGYYVLLSHKLACSQLVISKRPKKWNWINDT